MLLESKILFLGLVQCTFVGLHYNLMCSIDYDEITGVFLFCVCCVAICFPLFVSVNEYDIYSNV